MSIERWVPVLGFEQLYEVSNHGRVRSLPRTVRAGTPTGFRTTKTRYLKTPISKSNGYPMITLCGPSGHLKTTVHKVVLESFVGLRPLGKEARHLNGIRADVRLTNLEWGTPLENAADKVRYGGQAFGDKHWNTKICNESVARIREAALFGAKNKDLANAYGVSPATITGITKRTQRIGA